MLVLDTSVIVAGLYSRLGASHALLTRAVGGRLSFAVSVALALEYEAVLSRENMERLSWASPDQISAVLDALLARAVLATPIKRFRRPMLRDADDDMVLECALEAQATAIVTLNIRDFATAATTFGLRVLKPGACLADLRRGEAP